MFSKLKSLLKKLPVPLSKNHRYDLLTKKIIQQYCTKASNCVDVGAHRGDVLQLFLKYAPEGKHYAFEPLPHLHTFLKKKYSGRNCSIYNIAIANYKALVPFNYVISNPAYSGLKKRKYDKKGETDTTIEVQTDTLDNLIPDSTAILFIKIDVEGGELDVLKGATRILSNNHPIIVFEFGIGGSDVYGATPDALHSFFESFQYRVFLLEDFINKRQPLTLEELKKQFYSKLNYYFVAY
jgi:FkbM family methyltransferase